MSSGTWGAGFQKPCRHGYIPWELRALMEMALERMGVKWMNERILCIHLKSLGNPVEYLDVTKYLFVE